MQVRADDIHGANFFTAAIGVEALVNGETFLRGVDGSGRAINELGGGLSVAAHSGHGLRGLILGSGPAESGVDDHQQVGDEFDVWIVLDDAAQGVLIDTNNGADGITGSEDEALIETSDGRSGNVLIQQAAEVGVEPEFGVDGAIVADGEIDAADILHGDADEDGLAIFIGSLQRGDLDGVNTAGSLTSCRKLCGTLATRVATVPESSEGWTEIWNNGLNSDQRIAPMTPEGCSLRILCASRGGACQSVWVGGFDEDSAHGGQGIFLAEGFETGESAFGIAANILLPGSQTQKHGIFGRGEPGEIVDDGGSGLGGGGLGGVRAVVVVIQFEPGEGCKGAFVGNCEVAVLGGFETVGVVGEIGQDGVRGRIDGAGGGGGVAGHLAKDQDAVGDGDAGFAHCVGFQLVHLRVLKQGELEFHDGEKNEPAVGVFGTDGGVSDGETGGVFGRCLPRSSSELAPRTNAGSARTLVRV